MGQMGMKRACLCAGEHVDGGGAACPSGLSGPPDGAGDRGDPPALRGQEEAHPGRHRGQKAQAAELLRRGRAFRFSAAALVLNVSESRT